MTDSFRSLTQVIVFICIVVASSAAVHRGTAVITNPNDFILPGRDRDTEKTGSVVQTVCPSNETIFPCSCYDFPNWGIDLDCRGGEISQDSIVNLFQTIRLANNLTPYEWLTIDSFSLIQTPLAHLDLTPLVNSHIYTVYLVQNYGLTSIIGPDDIHYEGSIDVRFSVQIMYSPLLDDSGLGDSLKYFGPNLTHLNLLHNNFRGSEVQGKEFFPRLSSIQNLYVMNFGYNNISRLVGGQFMHNPYLGGVYMEGNPIIEMTSDAFRISDEVPHDKFWIGLSSCGLVDTSFDEGHGGLDTFTQTLQLDVSSNNLTTLSQHNFEPFLRAAHGDNILVVGSYHPASNPLICNENVKWLKDGRVEFEARVIRADCFNDPGQTVFNSTFIP